MNNFDVIEAVGGPEAMKELMTVFYDRLFDDIMIGYFFAKSDKEQLINAQIAYVHAHLGTREGTYEGPSIRRSHEDLAIGAGHFDRRQRILEDVLEEFKVPDHVREAWLNLDLAMRPMVLRLGSKLRGGPSCLD